jgi:hypothetical protein
MRRVALLTILLCCCTIPIVRAAAPVTVAATIGDNQELAGLYGQDQADRNGKNIDWSAVVPRDRSRQARVRALLASGSIRTAADYHHAAMVFQHGDTAGDIRLANALATMAMTLSPDDKGYRWLAAATWDRLMMYSLQPQWYGTQFKGDAKGMYLFPVAENAVTDDERKAMMGHTLAESREHVEEVAKDSGLPVRIDPPTIEELRRESSSPGEQ